MHILTLIFALIPCSAIVIQAYLFYVHYRLSEFIEYANKNKEALCLKRHVPDLYFPFYLSRCHYGFAIHMYKMKALPEGISEKFPDYRILRRLTCIALFSHISLGGAIIVLVIVHQLILNM